MLLSQLTDLFGLIEGDPRRNNSATLSTFSVFFFSFISLCRRLILDESFAPFIAVVAEKQTTHENKIKTGRRCVCVCVWFVSNGSGGEKTPR